MLTVRVKLFATLRPYRPELGLGESFPVELAEGSTVGGLIEELGLLPDQVKIVFVNGLVRNADRRLDDGDEVALFPPVGGG